jgi:hypothetical protein
MKSIQYTIRSIPPAVDEALRKQAKQQRTSLNEVIVRSLEWASGVSETKQSYTDLDHLFGKGIADEKSFAQAMEHLELAPTEKDFRL